MRAARGPPITAGSRVRVVQGRQFQNFGAGDTGVAVHVDREAGTCDVAFDGREGQMTVAARYLEADPSSLAKSSAAAHGPAPVQAQLLEDHLGNQRPRAASDDSTATDPNGHELYVEEEPRMISVLSASSGPPDRPSPQLGAQRPRPQPSRCVAEVLHDVRRAREAHRQGAATLQGAGELCGGEVAAALGEAMQASASATAAATASAMTEVGCLRQAFSELRELILLEAEQRVAGLREVHDGLEQVRAGQSPYDAGSESLLRAEQRRLEQKQAELLSLCASLQSLKDQHREHLTSPRGVGGGLGAAATPPTDWELSVQLPLTARLNSLDARLMLMDERLALLGGQVSALAAGHGAQPAGQRQEPVAGLEQRLAALGHRVDALAQGQAQASAYSGSQQAKIAAEFLQAQEMLRAETGRLGAELRSAASEVLGKMGGDTAGLFKAQAEAERDRSNKVLESLQARLDSLSQGLAAEAHARETAVSQIEAQVRRVCGEAERKAHLRASSATPGSLAKAQAAEKPVEPRVLTAERPLEPRVAQTEMQVTGYAGQKAGTTAGQAARLQSSADRTLRRLRAELGSSSSAAVASGSPRMDKPATLAALATAGTSQPRTPRSGLAAGSEVEADAATLTPGSTATTGACAGEEAPAPGAAPVTRVLRMESSPVRKSPPQVSVVPQRGMLRGGLVGVDLNHSGRPDLIVSGLDLGGGDTLHHGMPCPAAAQTQVGGHLGTPSVPMSGPGPGATVMPPGAMLSPGVPMMPLHLGASPCGMQGQPAMGAAFMQPRG